MLDLHLTSNLALSRCPHCSVARPNLQLEHQVQTNNHTGKFLRQWAIYGCRYCGGLVTAWSGKGGGVVQAYFPTGTQIDQDIPDRPRVFLTQAQESLHAPSGALMLCASSVDAMLKLKGYVQGNLYSRIDKAVSDHVITADMGAWAHAVRLDANDQRHADEAADLPTEQDAQRAIDFTASLAEIMFVLPSRVQRGLAPG